MRILAAVLWVSFFSVSALAGDTFQFITFGDWGSGEPAQQAVADAATRYCSTQNCGFVLTLGDNFYQFGVGSTQDPKWKTYFKDVYKNLNLPFYAVIGNHDERGSIPAQIDYGKIDSSWRMPGEFYSIKVPNGVASPVVEIFVINNGDDQFQPDEKAWLEKALSQSKATWKILALHKPIISNGQHGDDSADINDGLVPIICGKVDLALSGHDHNFSYLKGSWDKCPIAQLVVGTGGKEVRAVNTKDPRIISTGFFFGFGWFAATPETLKFRMIKTDGSVFYETTWKK